MGRVDYVFWVNSGESISDSFRTVYDRGGNLLYQTFHREKKGKTSV